MKMTPSTTKRRSGGDSRPGDAVCATAAAAAAARSLRAASAWLLLLLFVAAASSAAGVGCGADAFVPPLPPAESMSARTTCTSSRSISAIVPSAALASASCTQLSMAAAKKKKSKAKKKKSSSGGGGGGLKGFGSSVATSSSSSSAGGAGGGGGTIDRSKDALAFYDYLEKHGAGDNLKRVALATFPLVGVKTSDGQDIRIRGVMATRQIKKGEPIIDVPYELAMNLGRESSDPTLPAVALLQDYCRWRSGSSGSSEGRSTGSSGGNGKREDGGNDRDDRGAYFQMLPPYRGDDCRGSTDFFSDAALEALQFPPIRDETVRRREQTAARYERDVEPMTQISDNLYRWTDGGDGGGDSDSKADSEVMTEEHLRWAVWLVTSRVLTVQGEENTGEAYRLMIPLIDMCNHDRGSVHVLTGRAVPGGRLKILAGETIEAGSQVNIPYGGGVAGNDRFIQDYGFLDAADGGFAFDVVARALVGGGGEFGRTLMGQRDRTAVVEALKTTTIEQDETELEGTTERDMREALAFRIGVKRALERLDAA